MAFPSVGSLAPAALRSVFISESFDRIQPIAPVQAASLTTKPDDAFKLLGRCENPAEQAKRTDEARNIKVATGIKGLQRLTTQSSCRLTHKPAQN